MKKMYQMEEIERAEKAGMKIGDRSITISDPTVPSLAITRSFGDFDLKSNSKVGGLENQGIIGWVDSELLCGNPVSTCP